MLAKKIVFSTFLIILLFGTAGLTYSQDDGGVKIKLPDISIIIGGTYDKYGYDRNGYDCNGYNRNGYDRYGYNRNGYDCNGYNRYGYDCNGYDRYGYDRYGYDREGYDRNGCDRNGYYRNTNTYYHEKKHHDNGKHKGWYKHNDGGRWDDRDGDRDDD